MFAKQYLESIRNLDTKIRQREEQKRELQVEISSLSSPDTSSELVSIPIESDALIKKMIRLNNLERDIEITKMNYLEEKNRIIDEIQRLENPNHVIILYEKYVKRKTLKTIAREIHFSNSHVKRLHKEALTEFERINEQKHE